MKYFKTTQKRVENHLHRFMYKGRYSGFIDIEEIAWWKGLNQDRFVLPKIQNYPPLIYFQVDYPKDWSVSAKKNILLIGGPAVFISYGFNENSPEL